MFGHDRTWTCIWCPTGLEPAISRSEVWCIIHYATSCSTNWATWPVRAPWQKSLLLTQPCNMRWKCSYQLNTHTYIYVGRGGIIKERKFSWTNMPTVAKNAKIRETFNWGRKKEVHLKKFHMEFYESRFILLTIFAVFYFFVKKIEVWKRVDPPTSCETFFIIFFFKWRLS